MPVAIQAVSGRVPTEKVYKHTGWHMIDGKPVYLHAGGGIGESGVMSGVRIELPDALKLFRLPAPPSGSSLVEAVRASMGLLGIGPYVVTVPLYAAIWRVALGATDFTLHLIGLSGAGKSVSAAFSQQHFGQEMDYEHLPANWLSTGNANELIAFYAKDAIVVVDDLVPAAGGTISNQQNLEADRLLRGQGNRTGRGRMRSDATLREARPSRAKSSAPAR